MLLHVEPDELIAAGHRMSEDGALHALGERGAAVLTVLAAAAETLSVGLADSGRRYGDVEDRLAVLGRRVIG
jgi:hypothetical protein